jgi:hypothetical protein
MARSTGPLLAVGAITVANQTVFNKQPINWRIPIATGIVALSLSLVEHTGKAGETFAVGLAWLALVTVLLTRTDPKTPSPVETALKWWNSGGK